MHEVRMQEAEGYVPTEELHTHRDLSDVDWLHLKREPSGAIRIEHQPAWASFPVTRRMVHLGTLAPGQSARYRANFRLSDHPMTWVYHDWSVNMAHEAPHGALFLNRRYDFDRDDRVSLYGKPAQQ